MRAQGAGKRMVLGRADDDQMLLKPALQTPGLRHMQHSNAIQGCTGCSQADKSCMHACMSSPSVLGSEAAAAPLRQRAPATCFSMACRSRSSVRMCAENSDASRNMASLRAFEVTRKFLSAPMGPPSVWRTCGRMRCAELELAWCKLCAAVAARC